jgi:uncharacterized membrane protein
MMELRAASTPEERERSDCSPVVIAVLAAAALIAAWLDSTSLAVLLVLALGAYLLFRRLPRTAAERELRTRLQALEQRVRELQRTVEGLRSGAAAPRVTTDGPAAPAPKPSPPSVTATPQRQAPARPPLQPKRDTPARAFDWGGTISTADLMGAKALAFAGGVVTLLGVVFFFVLAVNRGWIGPEIRVACGGTASAIVFGGGMWLRRRYGDSYSALAAVGVGIAGVYATLLAAVSLYDLVSRPVALVVAAAVAAIGVAVSIAWESEIVAGFGLIGAMLVPATLVFQGGLQQVGTAFVAIVFAGATAVAVHRRWWNLLRAAAIVSVPQALAQVAQAGAPHAGIVVLAAAFWIAYVAAGVAYQLRLGKGLAASPATFLTGSAVFAGIAAPLLYGQRHDGLEQGIALLVVAGVYSAAGAGLFRFARDVATLVWALGLVAAAVGVAQVLSGSSVTYAWAAEAALLAWLSVRVRDVRFQVASLAYLVLAVGHALAFEARPELLFQVTRHPAKGAPALVAIVVAALVIAVFARARGDEEGAGGILAALEPALAQLRRHQVAARTGACVVAAVLAAYAASLAVLELFQDVSIGGDLDSRFDWGHVAVSGMWSAAGLAAVLVAVWRRSAGALVFGFSWLGLTVAKVAGFDLLALGNTQYGITFLIVGVAVLAAAIAWQLDNPYELRPTSVGGIVISLPPALAGALTLLGDTVWGVDGTGFALLVVGVAYTTLAAGSLTIRHQRDLATLLGGLGLAVVAVGEFWLLSGFWLALAWAMSAAVLAGISTWRDEARALVASLCYLVLGAGVALIDQAPPSNLLVAKAHPGTGIPSLLFVVGAAAVFAGCAKGRLRLTATWAAGTLAVYTASLGILDAMQRISPAGVHTDFQRGHTAVSAFWGVLALISLSVGLTRRRRLLRVGGFALFAVSLGKIFLYDLPSLSSAQRALSFLAVGAVLLFGGFVYQRLSAQLDEREA